MIHDWIAEYIKKYSFVNRYEKVGTNWVFYLEDDCALKSFKLNRYRTTKRNLIKKILEVKKAIGYDDDKGDWKKQIKN